MKLVDATTIGAYLTALGARQPEPVQLSLLGGCALILLGSLRTTVDIDYVGDDIRPTAFQETIAQVASEFQLDVEPVPIGKFVPIPPDSEQRRIFIARYGVVDVYVADPYVIALGKLDRGFDTDIDDIVYLLGRGLLNLESLNDLVTSTLAYASAYNIDPVAMRRHVTIVRERASHP